MAAYLPLFRIQIQHEFFADGICRNLEFTPAPETAVLIQRHQLLLRSEIDGIALYRSSEPNGVVSPDVHLLRFLVFSSDPEFQLYTAGFDKKTRQPLYCTSEVLDGQRMPLQALPGDFGGSAARSPYDLAPPGQRKSLIKPCLVVDINVSEADFSVDDSAAGQEIKSYLISLEAAKIYWKYYFFGEFAKKAIEISDLNTATAGIGFESSVMPVAQNGAAFVSTVAIPMQEVPTQRFQLREKEEAGRVLIKRLPNAGTRKIGKEKLRDGGEVLVAEIYINQ